MDNEKSLEEIFIKKEKVKISKSMLIGLIIISILSGLLSSYWFNFYYMKSYDGSKNSTSPKITEKVSVEEDSGIVDAVKKVSPSVVSVTSTAKGMNIWGEVVEQKGGGTGFIVTNDGLILTNKHVVSGSNEITIITTDGKDYIGKVVATDPLFDFALVKIDAQGLPVVELGDSDSIDIGQRVVAIGNALGEYDNSVTSGIISGRARAITTSDRAGSSERLEGLIQTDAPINPGNSGGPLINIRGQVVGVNTAIDSTANSIGFALPINSAKVAINTYLKNGKITRPYIGVRYINITREYAAINIMEVTSGALILGGNGQGNDTLAVVPGSPADKAGFQVNDIITEINDEKIVENKSVIAILSSYAPGDKVEIKYLRKGEEKKTEVTLGEMK